MWSRIFICEQLTQIICIRHTTSLNLLFCSVELMSLLKESHFNFISMNLVISFLNNVLKFITNKC